MYTHDSCSYATQPRMNSTPSAGLVLRRRSRGMRWIRSPVVTSRSLFQTVGYQVTCMHITVSLITFIELLSIHCKHDTHKNLQYWSVCASLSPKICFWRSRRSRRSDSRVPSEMGEREKIRRQRGSSLFFFPAFIYLRRPYNLKVCNWL